MIKSQFINNRVVVTQLLAYREMSSPNNLFGKEIKRLRQIRGLSQDELSRLSGVSLGLISQIERGKHVNPGTLTVARLDKALKCRGRLFKFIYESMN